MRETLTHAIEDYLKAIYLIQTAQDGRAATNQLAEYLNLTPASVTGMIQKLATTQPPLVEYQKHRGVSLTPAGEKIALEIVRHHRLLELYLHQMLGYDWDTVHAEADRLEHVISEEFEERIAQALGDPSHDPHGDPIPTRDLTLPQSPTTRLSDLHAKQRAIVHRVRDTDPELLRYLSEIGLVPQATITVLEVSPYDDNLRLQLPNETAIILGPRITRQIFVEILENASH
ncbi:MAG: metal-dependent transcriptional regulator [Anaerolineales bacterium]